MNNILVISVLTLLAVIGLFIYISQTKFKCQSGGSTGYPRAACEYSCGICHDSVGVDYCNNLPSDSDCSDCCNAALGYCDNWAGSGYPSKDACMNDCQGLN